MEKMKLTLNREKVTLSIGDKVVYFKSIIATITKIDRLGITLLIDNTDKETYFYKSTFKTMMLSKLSN